MNANDIIPMNVYIKLVLLALAGTFKLSHETLLLSVHTPGLL